MMAAKTTPTRQSDHTRVGFGLFGGLAGGLVLGLVGALAGGVNGALVGVLVGVLIFGLVVGLVVGLNYGGLAVIQHYTLRWMLYRNDSLPFRDLIPFLDYCVERIFLRRVGGGYIFIHRLLLEPFASLEENPSSRPKERPTDAA